MEPMTWSVLAASTATWSVRKLANLAAGSAWKDKIEPAFKRSGLDHELARAYEAAFDGFVTVLRGPFAIDDAMDARLRVMFADDGIQAILAELPRARFEDVDVARARELFAGLGLPGAGDLHFDFAWATFGRAFGDRIAQTTHAARLAELSRQDRIEGYLAELAASVRPRDESAALAAYRRYVEDLYRLADTRGLFWREKETTGEEIHLADVFVEVLLERRHPGYVRLRDKEQESRRDDEEPAGDRELRFRDQDRREEPRGADDEATRAAFEARLADEDKNVRASAVTYFVGTGLRDRATAVLDAFAAGASGSTSTETDRKLSAAAGRLVAEDPALLQRITEQPIQHFDRFRAFTAAAERRDEIRRESTPLAGVLSVPV